MRFQCSPSEENIKEYLTVAEKKYGNWHKKFAWFPTHIEDGKCVWFEYYERRYAKILWSTYFEDLIIDEKEVRFINENF